MLGAFFVYDEVLPYTPPTERLLECAQVRGCRSVRSAVFTKVGTYIVSSAEDDTVKVWDLKYMKAPTTIIRQRMGVNRSVVPRTSSTCEPLPWT